MLSETLGQEATYASDLAFRCLAFTIDYESCAPHQKRSDFFTVTINNSGLWKLLSESQN